MPAPSVTVNVTLRGVETPSSVLPSRPQMSVKEKLLPLPVSVNAVWYVYFTVHE